MALSAATPINVATWLYWPEGESRSRRGFADALIAKIGAHRRYADGQTDAGVLPDCSAFGFATLSSNLKSRKVAKHQPCEVVRLQAHSSVGVRRAASGC